MKKQLLNNLQIKKTITIFQWLGGKVRLADKLVETLPKTYNNYFEPFIGAGSLFFKEVPENGYISDMNYELINCYKVICSHASTWPPIRINTWPVEKVKNILALL